MKGSWSCTLVASVFAASTGALVSSSSAADDASFSLCCCSSEGLHSAKSDRREATKSAAEDGKENFAPRFDGLRFIETLVTAHR